MTKVILIIGAIVLAGLILQKIIFPALKGLFKLAITILVPLIIVGVIVVVVFVGAAAFSGMAEQPTESGNAPLTEQFESIDSVNDYINEDAWTELEKKSWFQKADQKVRNWQAKHQ